MASIINASSSGSGGIVQTADASGVLQLQSNGTVVVTVDTSTNVGIGVTSPVNKLSIAYSATDFGASILVNNTSAASGSTPSIRFVNAGSSTGLVIGKHASAYAEANLAFINQQTTGPLAFFTDGTERMRINPTSAILCLAGGSTSATGTGIAFPATQAASTNANTLDDYEEGSWTPSISFDSGPSSISYSSQVGRYTKIGNMVTIWFYIQVGTVSGGSGSAYVDGLPFTNNGAMQGGAYNNWSNSGFLSTFSPAIHIPTNQARGYLIYVSGGATPQLPYTQVIANTQIIMSGQYYV